MTRQSDRQAPARTSSRAAMVRLRAVRVRDPVRDRSRSCKRYDTNTRCARRRVSGDSARSAGTRLRRLVRKGEPMAMDLAIREADGVKIRFAEAGQGGSETVGLDQPMAGERARLPKGMGPPGRAVPPRRDRPSRIRSVGASARPAVAVRDGSIPPAVGARSGTWVRCISSPLMSVRPPPCGRPRMIPRSCAAWRSAAGP